RVSYVLEPFDMLAVERFLHGEVLHRIIRRGAVPMLLARRNPHGIAGADFADRPTPGLHAANAGENAQRLSEWMRVPGSPRAGLEAHEAGTNARGIRRLDDRLLPHGAGERGCRTLA